MSKLYLALALHNHQPVGNFEYVFEEAYLKAYLPMLQALERHPAVRLAIHNTGPLLDWLFVEHPEYVERLAALAHKGQVEIMTGGYYEPILVSLPDVDKVGQIHKLSQTLQSRFGYQPTGAWLAERVWEPHLPKPLHEAGVDYIVIDDTHLRYAGKTDEEMFGYYVTEEQGYPLKIFASAKYLRYSIPWLSAKEVIHWLRQTAETTALPRLYANAPKVAVMGDDGEKFGLWPNTYRHCWTKGWVEQFFTALEENRHWLVTITPGDYARQFGALGQVYMTAASYDEMTEWALSSEMSAGIVVVKKELREQNREDILHFLKGGLWRGFLAKYAEVNQMHKKTLWVSRKVHALPEGEVKQQALDLLWAAQCNCGYWHGLFGGIYLFHIRGANYRNLINAEKLADGLLKGSGWLSAECTDFDRDGADEWLLSNEQQWLCLDLAQGGMLTEWDWRNTPYNLLNGMTRYYEWYHAELKKAAATGKLYLYVKPTEEEEKLEEETKNVHDRGIMVKELGLEKRLFYDSYRRGGLQDHFWGAQTTLAEFASGQYKELGDFLSNPYTATLFQTDNEVALMMERVGMVNGQAVQVQKRVILLANSPVLQVTYHILNRSRQWLQCRFGVENSWGLEGGQDHLTYFVGLEDEGGHRTFPGDAGTASEISQFSLISEIITVRSQISLTLSKPADVGWFAYESVTNSESGYEANYQGTSVTTHWGLNLAPEQSWQVELTFKLS